MNRAVPADYSARSAGVAVQQTPAAAGNAGRTVKAASHGPIRIIAWGNRGRRDDGVALVLAERLEARYASDRDVIVQQYHQLGPEVAYDLCHSRRAIFIDADIRATGSDVHVERLTPAVPEAFNTHHCPPAVLLGLGESLGWKMPPAYLVGVRAYDLSFGDDLSEATRDALARAEARVVELVNAARCGGQRHA